MDKFEYLSQESAPWGLSRISHRDNGFTNYVYDSSAGEGTCVVSTPPETMVYVTGKLTPAHSTSSTPASR